MAVASSPDRYPPMMAAKCDGREKGNVLQSCTDRGNGQSDEQGQAHQRNC